MSRSYGKAVIVGLLLAVSPPVDGAPKKRADLRFRVHVEKERRGRVHCGLYAAKSKWLSEHTYRDATARVSGPWATCIFEGVPTGHVYALTAFHDEDGDGEMDFNFIGIPEEGYAASRDAHRKRLGAPRWKDARFKHLGPTTQRAHISY